MKSLRRGTPWAAAAAALLLQTNLASAGEIVWWTPNWGQARAEELIKKFKAANPGITVKLEITVSDGLANRILVALRSGSPPDLIEGQHGWVYPIAQSDLLQPLDDVITGARGLRAGRARIRSPGTASCGAFPTASRPTAVIYNKDAFRDAGLDPEKPPQTWPELIDAAKKLTGKNAEGQDQYGFAITGGGEVGNTLFRSLPFIWMNGGAIITDDMTKAVVNEPAAVEAVKFYTDMFTELGVSPPSTLQNDGTANRRLFIAGTVAMYQSGQFDLPSIQKENPTSTSA